MSAIHRVAAIATDLTCQAVGRRTVVRTARYVLSRARLDYPNDLSAIGESPLQHWILRFSHAGEQIHVADMGANVDWWSESMLAAVSKAGRETDLRLQAFEQDSRAFARLAQALDGARASLSRTALSDRPGTSPLHVLAPAAGTNSLYLCPTQRKRRRKTWSRSRWIHTLSSLSTREACCPADSFPISNESTP